MSNSKNISSPNPGKTELIMLLVIFGLIFLVFKCSCSDNDEKKVMSEEEQKFSAYYNSQECVKDLLKSPSTAEFPSGSEQFVTRIDNDTFLINSYVDSQNSFGAMLRTKFVCQITLNDNNTYTCDNVELLEQ